jgi:hypothetical protein
MNTRKQLSETGSVIITILVMMVILSLGVGVVLMFSTSTLQQAEHNIELKARHLADAGFRYAAGEYVSAGDLSAKFARLEALHNETVSLLNNDGTFTIQVYPFWFISQSDYTNATRIALKVPGKFPDNFQSALPSSGVVKIVDDFYGYTSGIAAVGSGNNPDTFTITLDKGVTILKDTSVHLVFAPETTQTVMENGDLTIDQDNGLLNIFPRRNGLFEIFEDETQESGTYRYRERKTGSVILSDITPVEDNELPLVITPSSRIVLKKQALIETTGNLGTGNIASNRGLSLNVYLSDELKVPQDTAETLDLGGSGSSKHEDFNDEESGVTQLKNWEYTPDDTIPESEKKTITTHTVQPEFGAEWTSTNYVTFQNFTEYFPEQGYEATVVSKDDIDDSVETKDYYGIWGNASDNIFICGSDGTIIKYDGQLHNGVKWVKQTSNSSARLRALWGTPSISAQGAPDQIISVGDTGEIIEYQNGTWSRITYTGNWNCSSDVTNNYSVFDIYGVYGTGWDHITTYGDYGSSPYKWSQGPWRRYCGTPPAVSTSWRWKSYNYQYYGAIWRPYDYKSWRDRMFRANWEVKSGTTDHIFSVGYDQGGSPKGFVFKEKPNSNSYYKTLSTVSALNGIWGSSLNNIYSVGSNGTILRSTNGTNSNAWQEITSPTTQNLNGVYGASDSYIYAVGDDGTILYYGGEATNNEWQKVDGVTSNTLNSVWGSDRTGLYAVGNNGTIIYLGYPSNKIGGHILPLSKNSELSAKWSSTDKYLSYSIQAKTLWGDDLHYGVSGINFRWHQPVSGKYAGYGISFMRYDSSLNEINDKIPDTIKPEFQGVNEKHDKLLIVLWEQYVENNIENRRWLAYKDISADSNVVKADDGTPRDLSSLIIRVHEKKVEGVKVNDIEVFYGNASADSQSVDSVYNNTTRGRYNPTFGPLSDTINWPVSDLENWRNCGNPSPVVTCSEADKYTLVDNVSVEATPTPGNASVRYWVVNPNATQVILKNNYTIRAHRFTTPGSGSFGTQSARSEIGLHVFGDIGDYNSQSLVSFTDFAVQLGVDAEAIDTESGFGSIQ